MSELKISNNKNTDLIEKFYEAFKILDAEAMAECYHDAVVFKDPAFGILKGNKAKNMWRMLCANQKGKDFKISYSNIKYSDGKGSAHWQAYYTFGKTGRKIHNKIDAEFEFKDGKIIKHTDRFNLYSWSQQAFGFTGYMMGWTSFFKKKLQKQTKDMILEFEVQKVGKTP
ncbi:MAG: nuclear transport factor 2 family protein [Flavobacteriaceae bacterium]|nr:nuclear transport factor 2 family protein [Flavobacteriaceae bacterium]